MFALRTFSRARPSTLPSLRLLSTSFPRSAPAKNDFDRPSPPQLPRAEQKAFEELLRQVNAPASQAPEGTIVKAVVLDDEGLKMHPDFRSKPKAGFEGEINPETGEVGGPKREPLEHGDWSYGGKCTDF